MRRNGVFLSPWSWLQGEDEVFFLFSLLQLCLLEGTEKDPSPSELCAQLFLFCLVCVSWHGVLEREAKGAVLWLIVIYCTLSHNTTYGPMDTSEVSLPRACSSFLPDQAVEFKNQESLQNSLAFKTKKYVLVEVNMLERRADLSFIHQRTSIWNRFLYRAHHHCNWMPSSSALSIIKSYMEFIYIMTTILKLKCKH